MKHAVALTWLDGSYTEPMWFDDYEAAYASAKVMAVKNPSARVWLDETIISRGFIAADEADEYSFVATEDYVVDVTESCSDGPYTSVESSRWFSSYDEAKQYADMVAKTNPSATSISIETVKVSRA